MASIEVGYAVGLVSCDPGCPPPDTRVGLVLYNHPFHPERHEDGGGYFYENITLAIPPEFPKGVAQINTVRLHMIGVNTIPLCLTLPLTFAYKAGPAPIFEANSVQIEIV